MNTVQTQPQTGTDRRAGWIITGLMVLTIILSFVFFQHQSLRLDESQSLWQTSHTPVKILNLIAQDVHVPLYHMILHVWQFLFGNGVTTARLLSLIFFLISIPVMYILGKRAFSTRISLFATTLFAISPFMNWYGNEIRMYSLFVLLTLLNQYFFLRLFRRDVGDDMTGSWVGFAVTALLGMYTHYFFALILATNAIFYFFNRDLFPSNALRNFIKTAVLIAVAFAPWLTYMYMLGRASNTSPSLQAPTSVNVFNTFSQFLFGFQTDHLNTIFLSLWPITVLLGFMALRRNKRLMPQTLYFILCFILPNVMAFVVSFLFRPVYLTRYLIFTLPSMYFFLSWLISSYPKIISVSLRYVVILIMAVTMITEAVSAATPVKENYKEASDYLEQNANPADVIAVSSPFTIYPMLYYYKGPVTIETLPLWDRSKFGPIPAFSMDKLPSEIDQIKGEHRNLWLLLSYDQGYQEDMRIYFDNHFEQLEAHQFSPGLTLYKYKLRYDVSMLEIKSSSSTRTSSTIR